MKKKNLLLAALALTALAGCSDDTFVGEQGLQGSIGTNGAISFNMSTPAVTRADDKTGGDAATDLGNQFIVWGEKNEAGTGAEASAANLVFKNYQVNYETNTAYNTTSNTKNWEYVGYTHSHTASTDDYQTNITPSLAVAQTIKYWDYGASKYTFTAVSAKQTDLQTGKVKIQKLTSGESSSDYNKGYEITVGTGASVDNIFVADRNVIDDKSLHDRTAMNKYGGNVTMKFRNFMSKIRFGIYETIPGYKVKITKVYYKSTNSTANFGIDGKFITAGDNTIFKVTYEGSGTHENRVKAALKYAVDDATYPAANQGYFETVPGTSGGVTVSVPFLTATQIGTSATGATFNKAETVSETTTPGIYTTILPYSGNATNLKLKIDFQLISEDTGETIDITGKTAEVPATFCQWLPNYAYSYIFKITDDGLYPITFDAVEVVDETGEAEYITTVTEPSITTFGVKSGVYSTGLSEYADGTDIYATFVKGTEVQTPSLTESTKANYVQIYYVTTSDATNFPITEAAVAERLAETPAGTAKLTCTNITTSTSTDYFKDGTAPAVVDVVPSEDGSTKTIKAVLLDNVKTNTGAYAIEIVTYSAVTLSSGANLNGYYSESGGVYTKQTSGTYSSGTYYKQIKTYKIIKVVAGS